MEVICRWHAVMSDRWVFTLLTISHASTNPWSIEFPDTDTMNNNGMILYTFRENYWHWMKKHTKDTLKYLLWNLELEEGDTHSETRSPGKLEQKVSGKWIKVIGCNKKRWKKRETLLEHPQGTRDNERALPPKQRTDRTDKPRLKGFNTEQNNVYITGLGLLQVLKTCLSLSGTLTQSGFVRLHWTFKQWTYCRMRIMMTIIASIQQRPALAVGESHGTLDGSLLATQPLSCPLISPNPQQTNIPSILFPQQSNSWTH